MTTTITNYKAYRTENGAIPFVLPEELDLAVLSMGGSFAVLTGRTVFAPSTASTAEGALRCYLDHIFGEVEFCGYVAEEEGYVPAYFAAASEGYDFVPVADGAWRLFTDAD